MSLFSLPLNPKLSEKQFMDFLSFVQKYKQYIFDIYFTARVPPFVQDAMGEVFVSSQDLDFMIDSALYIQKQTGITLSATFNNINVSPLQENLDIFIKNFSLLYEKGIRSATIPHSHWVATGQLQKEFPDLFIKNTILRKVTKANEIVGLAELGFNYINLHRDLLRDCDSLKEIKKAKDFCHSKGLLIKLSLLINEGCEGNCLFMDEHFCYNNTRRNNPQYFASAISRVSCSKNEVFDSAKEFKSVNVSPWRDDLENFNTEYGIDVFKLHGRENISRLFESLTIIDNYANNKKYIFNDFETYVEKFPNKSIDVWRDKIKNCKYNCWSCNYCNNIAPIIPISNKIKLVLESFDKSAYNNYKNNIQGLTSQRVKAFLNLLASKSKNYVEVGARNGATFYSVIDNNFLHATAIDKWEEDVQPHNNIVLEKSSYQTFLENKNGIHSNSEITILKNDINKIDATTLKNIDLFFYDSEHSYRQTYNVIKKLYNSFDKEAILIFDDANWEGVIEAVNDSLASLKANIIFKKVILNKEEDINQWWNGLYIVIIQKEDIFNKEYYNLILTKECNKHCSFCFVKDYSKEKEMSLDFIKKILEHFPEMQKFNLLGGEPTNHSQFLEILNLLETNKKQYQLISNLLFSEDVLKNILNKNFIMLCNGMELEDENRLDVFSNNWEKLNDNNIETILAFTISKHHTEEYFKKYCLLIKEKIFNIKKIRIGLDLSGEYIINNHTLGNIVKIIWETLANENTSLIFDCFVPPCIFNFNLEDMNNLSPEKYSYFSSCLAPVMDILHDGSVLYCYQAQHIKLENIFNYSNIQDAVKELKKNYNKENYINKICLSCNHFKKNCDGLCLGCKG